MLVPNVKIEENKTSNNNEDFIIYNVDETIVENYLDLYNNLDDEKYFDKYVKYLEKLIRNSYEYKQYIYTLISEFDISSCKFFQNININEMDVDIEFHHYPFTLYDIVSIVLFDKMEKYKNLNEEKYRDLFRNSFFMAEEVMKLHYENKIGLVPLTKTVHELVHNGEIFIPLTKEYVYGNYLSFIKEYDININNYPVKISSLKAMTEKIINGEEELNLEKLKIRKAKIMMKETDLPHAIELEKEKEIV